MIRHKFSAADLKSVYPKVMTRCVRISFLLLLVLALLFPSFEMDTPAGVRRTEVLHVENIPETRQDRRPEPKRPAVPVETDSDDAQEDVTIESTELELDRVPLDLPRPVRHETAPVEEEVLEYWRVERQPALVRRTLPVYPEMAKRTGGTERSFRRGENDDAHPVPAERVSDSVASQVSRIQREEFHVLLVDRVGDNQPVLLDHRARILVSVGFQGARKGDGGGFVNEEVLSFEFRAVRR